MERSDNLKWIRIKFPADIRDLHNALLTVEYSDFTTDKHDKNAHPICFVGHKKPYNDQIVAVLAVWFRDDELEREGMTLIQQFAKVATTGAHNSPSQRSA